MIWVVSAINGIDTDMEGECSEYWPIPVLNTGNSLTLIRRKIFSLNYSREIVWELKKGRLLSWRMEEVAGGGGMEEAMLGIVDMRSVSLGSAIYIG